MSGIRDSPVGFYLKLNKPCDVVFSNKKYQKLKKYFELNDSILSIEEEEALRTDATKYVTCSKVDDGVLRTLEIQIQTMRTSTGEKGIVGVVVEPKGIYNIFPKTNPLSSVNDRSIYKEIIESSDDVIISLDSNFNIKYISPCTKNIRCSSILNCSCLGKSIKNFIRKDDFKSFYEKLKDKKAFNSTIRVYFKNIERIVNFNLTPIFNKQIFNGYYGIGRDVTEEENEKIKLQIRDSILTSLSCAMQDMLFGNIEMSLPKFIETIGVATCADRVTILKTERIYNTNTHRYEQSENPIIEVYATWNKDGEKCSNECILDNELEKIGRLPLSDFLGRHHNIHDHHICTKIDKCTVNYLCKGVKTRLIVPIRNVQSSEIIGFICIDSIKEEKEWSEEEISAMKIVTFNLDAAISMNEVVYSLEEMNNQCIQILKIIATNN